MMRCGIKGRLRRHTPLQAFPGQKVEACPTRATLQLSRSGRWLVDGLGLFGACRALTGQHLLDASLLAC